MTTLEGLTEAQGQQGIRTPEQWRDTLLTALARRMPEVSKCTQYYNGDHRMAFTTAQFRQVFGNLFGALADNWCDLIVDASAERLKVEGFRFGDEPADEAAWEIWQRNGLDAESDMAHTDAIKTGTTYALVGPDDADGKALIQIEPGDKAIVAMDPAMGRGASLACVPGLTSGEWNMRRCTYPRVSLGGQRRVIVTLPSGKRHPAVARIHSALYPLSRWPTHRH